MTLVLGLGNPLRGDDGIGPRVIESLHQRGLPAGVEALDAGAAGLDLLNLLDGPQRVIIVDAAEMGRAAGAVVRFRPEDVTLTGSAERFSLHGRGVADALALADALGIPLPEIVVYGVQPTRVGWGLDLSDEVAAALPGLVQVILKEMQE